MDAVSKISEEDKKLYAHECQIRNAYVTDMRRLRPFEKVISKETRYVSTSLRADLRTVDQTGLLREWEFKINADHHALGQLLTYIAHARQELNFRPLRGVIASFSFSSELRVAVEVMNLNIEFVTIPSWMTFAGRIPALNDARITLPTIPNFHLSQKTD